MSAKENAKQRNLRVAKEIGITLLRLGASADDGKRVFGPEFDPEVDGPRLLALLIAGDEEVTLAGHDVTMWALEHQLSSRTSNAISRAMKRGREFQDRQRRQVLRSKLRVVRETLAEVMVDLARDPAGLSDWDTGFVRSISKTDEAKWTPKQRAQAERIARLVRAGVPA